MNKADQKKLDKIFSALANKHRRQVVYLLSLQPAAISKLAKQLKLSLPAIHRHIKILEKANLVLRKKSGRFNFLALDRGGLLLLQEWTDQYHPQWGSNEESLENYVSGILEEKN